jgi:hypothetical protein
MTTTAPNSFWQKANQAVEQAENDAEAWRPDQGGPQSIAGQVTAISHRDAGYGPYPILTLRLQDNTVVAWHAMGTVAEGLVNDHNVQVGHGVAIAYRGKQTSRSGNEYTSWRLVVFDDTAEEENGQGGIDTHELAGEQLFEEKSIPAVAEADAPKPKASAAKGLGKSAASAQNDDDIPF